MQIKIFNIPIGGEEVQTEELNLFLRANKIIDIKKDLALIDGNSCWTFCITYLLNGKPTENENTRQSQKVDYKEVLEPEAFERFTNLRKLRREVAEQEAVPAFAVFTDAELAELAKCNPLTLRDMAKVPGIGKKKMEKYGSVFCTSENSLKNETSGIFEGQNSEP